MEKRQKDDKDEGIANDAPSSYGPLHPAHRRAAAIAIAGDQQHPDAPAKIVAAGYGKLAQQILELAFAKGVKVREDADLAEILAKLEIDTPIPSEAVIAVAEILAKVYEANEAAKASCPTTLTQRKVMR